MTLRFLVFIGSHYLPFRGWHDFKEDFATLEEALACAKYEIAQDPRETQAQVVDMKTRQIVWDKENLK